MEHTTESHPTPVLVSNDTFYSSDMNTPIPSGEPVSSTLSGEDSDSRKQEASEEGANTTDTASFHLSNSPRWNEAADKATAKGLRPGSSEWMEDIRNTISQQPDLNPELKHGAKSAKPHENGKRGEKKTPWGNKTRVESPTPRSEKPRNGRDETKAPEAREPFTPGIVHYRAIFQMLLKASRYRRQQYQQTVRGTLSVGEVEDFYSVAVSGVRQSGKTTFLIDRFLNDYATSLFVVADEDEKEQIALTLTRTKASANVQAMASRIVTVKDILDVLNEIKATGAGGVRERPKITLVVDPDDANPGQTVAALTADYLRLQKEYKDGTPSIPRLLETPLRTVYVDNWSKCQHRGLAFQRLVRYVRLGKHTPEYLLIG